MKKTKPEKYNKNWGYELWIENNEHYCGKILHINPKVKSSVHYHKHKKETFHVVNGVLVLEYSRFLDIDHWVKKTFDTINLKEGETFNIDNMIAHRFYSGTSTFCEFIEISTHHEEKDSYRIIPSK